MIVCVPWDSDGDADEPPRQKQAVGSSPLFHCGDISEGAVRAVYGTEDRVRALRGVEAPKDMRRGNGKGVARLVTGDTAPSVRAHGLEKGIGGCVRRSAEIQVGKAAVGIREGLVTANKSIASHGEGQDSSGTQHNEKT